MIRSAASRTNAENDWKLPGQIHAHQSVLDIVGMVPGSIALVCTGYTKDPVTGLLLLNVCLGLMGLHFPSVRVNCLDIAVQYSGILKGICNAISGITTIFGLPLVGALTPNQVGLSLNLKEVL